MTALAAMIALGLALAVGFSSRALGERFGLLDWPDPAGGRKLHLEVTPLVGGMAIVPAVVLAALLVVWFAEPSRPVSSHLQWFAGVVGALYLIGVADDRLGLGPRLRLLASITVFGVAVVYAPDFRVSFLLFTGSPLILFSGIGALIFSLLCLVGLLNAINMADGKNGLVIGISIVATVVLWIEAPSFLDPLFAALLCGLAVTFYFNMRGRLFLGDGGSYGLSAVLGLLAILSYNSAFDSFRADRLALLFAVPVIDTIRLITLRTMRGGSPFRADRNHLHHHVAGWIGWPRGLVVYAALILVPNLAALVWPRCGVLLLLLMLPLYAAALLLARRGEARNAARRGETLHPGIGEATSAGTLGA